MAKKNERTKTWDVFSRYIRHRDGLLTTGDPEQAICVTCGSCMPFNRLHAGHFIPGRNNAILFDTRGVNAQCIGCNMFANGRQGPYYQWMLKTHGQDVINELFERATKTAQFKKFHYQEFRERFERWDAQVLAGSLPDEDEFLAELQEIIR